MPKVTQEQSGPMAMVEGASAEQAADLARLEGLAAEAEPAPEVEEVRAAEPPKMDAEESLAGFIEVGAHLAGEFGMRRVAGVWTGEKCGRIAAAAVPVLRKYPWGAPVLSFLEGDIGAEEVALVAVSLPLVLATIKAVRADLADMQRGEEKQADKPVAREVRERPKYED